MSDWELNMALDNNASLVRHIEAQTAEIERLRDALAKVCLVKDSLMNPIHTIQDMRQIARAALAGKAEQ